MASTMAYDHSVFLNQWKDRMYEIVKSKYPNRKLSKEKVYAQLDQIISQRIDNPKLTVVNNYSNQSVRTDILSLIDLIEDNHLIIAGGGTLYHQHKTKRNVLIDFIIHVMDQRKFWKAERKKYPKGSYEYLYCDIMQLLQKLI